MKVKPSVKPMCDKCKVIKRNGKVMETIALRKKQHHSTLACVSQGVRIYKQISEFFKEKNKWLVFPV